MLFLINPLFLVSFCCQKLVERQAAPRTEVIGWDRLESPSLNTLLRTKLLSLDPLSWDMDYLLTLWPLLIPCSLGNGCCTFGFLFFIIVERNFLYNSLYILTERSLKHLCSIRQRRQWHPTPVLLPGESHEWRSLVGCSPWGRWVSNTAERLHFHFSLSCIGEGNGNPLHCSCLENPRDGEAWWAPVYGVAQSRTRLKWLSSSSSIRAWVPVSFFLAHSLSLSFPPALSFTFLSSTTDHQVPIH